MSQDILDGQTGNGENPMMQRALLTGLFGRRRRLLRDPPSQPRGQ